MYMFCSEFTLPQKVLDDKRPVAAAGRKVPECVPAWEGLGSRVPVAPAFLPPKMLASHGSKAAKPKCAYASAAEEQEEEGGEFISSIL